MLIVYNDHIYISKFHLFHDKSQFVFKCSNNNFNLEIYIIVNYNYIITIFSLSSQINNYNNTKKHKQYIIC